MPVTQLGFSTFVGTSTEGKPILTDKDTGSLFHETDTGHVYYWDGVTNGWDFHIPTTPAAPDPSKLGPSDAGHMYINNEWKKIVVWNGKYFEFLNSIEMDVAEMRITSNVNFFNVDIEKGHEFETVDASGTVTRHVATGSAQQEVPCIAGVGIKLRILVHATSKWRIIDNTAGHITDIHLMNAPFSKLDKTFMRLRGLTSFTMEDDSCKGITDLDNTWTDCSSMTSMQFKIGKLSSMNKIWYGCEKLERIDGKLDFTGVSTSNLADVFHGCNNLTAPAAAGTHVRDNNDATAGTWTNP